MALAALLAAVPTFGASEARAAGCSLPGAGTGSLDDLYSAISDLRRTRSLIPVVPSDELTAAAQLHACALSAAGMFQHVGPDGSGPMARVLAAGCRPSFVAENLALGQRDPAEVVEGWMGSSGHRQNLLSPRARAIGLGVAATPKGPLWVMVVSDGC